MLKKLSLITAALISSQCLFAAEGNVAKTQSYSSSCEAPSQPQHPRGYDQGHQVKQTQMISGYNTAARYDVVGSWDTFLRANFIFWQPSGEGLEVGSDNTLSSIPIPFSGSVTNMDFDFKPGFKIGLGFNSGFDNWDTLFEYTWLYMSDSTSVSSDSGALTSFWFDSSNNAPLDIIDSLSAKWRLRLNLFDFELGRAGYFGRYLTTRPFFGLRATWFRQKYTTTAIGPTAVDEFNATHLSKTTSWAIGPRAGLNTNWLFGMGFRGIGNVAASLLYNHHKAKITEDALDTAIGASAVMAHDSFNFLKPNFEIGVGLGWGTYFSNNNAHFDILATYDFQVFFGQNIMRYFRDMLDSTTGSSPGSLFLQGLNLAIQFDF